MTPLPSHEACRNVTPPPRTAAAGEAGSPTWPFGQPLAARKDIRHLSSRHGVAAVLQATNLTSERRMDKLQTALEFRADKPKATPASRLVTASSHGEAAELRAAAAAVPPPSSRKCVMSSSDSVGSLARARSLSKLRPWTDDDAKPRMAQRASDSGSRSPPATAREAYGLAPAGRPSYGRPIVPDVKAGRVALHTRAFSEEPRQNMSLSRWSSSSTLFTPVNLPAPAKTASSYSSWDALVAEAEEAGAALRQARRSDTSRPKGRHAEQVRAMARVPAAGQASSPSRQRSAKMQSVLRSSSQTSSFRGATPRSMKAGPNSSMREVLLSFGDMGTPRRTLR
eukprot:TRINITY_DN89285_c0_g1_i1.p1 TRINITY_DN89285_c0_g1~~TRINITY_DN89285_c0_g1_i1.p1  ORF type:complete len:348 (+),score=61.25 TRINITY_DN89285_c0_g1_i1:29-1045(+)